MENITKINVGGVDYEVRKDLADKIVELQEQIQQGTGSGGTTDYTDLENKPKINGHELSGNQSSEDLGLQQAGDYALKSEIPDTGNFATKEELNNITPTIGENGNWFINGEDTGKPAKGSDGADGVSLGEIALVQETGTESGSENKVMSQKAVSEKLTELTEKIGSQTVEVDTELNEESQKPIANAPVAKGINEVDERTKDIEKKVGYTQRQLVWSKQLDGTVNGVSIDYNFEIGETYIFSATKIKSGDVSFSQFAIRFNRGTYTVVINGGSAQINGTNFDYLNGKYEVEYTRNEEHPIELGGSGPAFANSLINLYKLVKNEGIYEEVQELLPLKDEELNYDTTEYNSVNKSDFKEQNATIYSTDGNTSTGENGYCSSEFIEIEENVFAITIWKVLRPIGAIPPIVFFDENNDFISAVPFGSDKYVKIPSQTKKYKWQNRSTDAGCILYSWHYRIKQILIDSVKLNLIRLSNIQSLYNPFLLLSNLRILCIGDSLTEGDHGKIEDGAVMNVKHTNYPFYLSKILNNLNITNAGKCGYTAKSWYNGEFSKYTYTDYDVVIILMGINGGLTDEHIDDGGDVEQYPIDNIAGYTAYYCKLIEELIKSNNKLQIVLCSYPHVQSINLEGTSITIPKIAYRYGCTHIDLSEIGVSVFTPNYLNNVDKLHLTELGYQRVASYIASQLAAKLSFVVE